jgi:4-diphosphocytidyl-2-C-methyl-D-erythritol kinase
VNHLVLDYPENFPLEGGAFAMLAPAKINLLLRVLGKRPDGYHELETVFQEISWCDRLEFHSARSWSLEILNADLDPGPSNLVTRAAHLLSRAANVPCHAHIRLTKDIPIGGGLGGGSSDAAIALLGLSRLWKLELSQAQLQALAAELGSDCAFFLQGGLAGGRGRGEQIEPLPGRFPAEVLIVVPPFGVSTKGVFEEGSFPLTHVVKNHILTVCSEWGKVDFALWKNLRNDLEIIVLRLFDDLVQIKERLLGAGAEAALVSGSGSAVYGVFKERARALRAAQQFGPPFQVRLCRTIERKRSR